MAAGGMKPVLGGEGTPDGGHPGVGPHDAVGGDPPTAVSPWMGQGVKGPICDLEQVASPLQALGSLSSGRGGRVGWFCRGA